jgi:hypothetical protein
MVYTFSGFARFSLRCSWVSVILGHVAVSVGDFDYSRIKRL